VEPENLESSQHSAISLQEHDDGAFSKLSGTKQRKRKLLTAES